MRAIRPWTWLALLVVAAAVGARVATWAPRGSGLRRADTYPAPTVPVPPGTRVTRLPPGAWMPRRLDHDDRPVLALRVEIVFPPGADAPDSSRYDVLYTAPAGGAPAPAAGPHRVVVLAGPPVGTAWARRAAALTRPGQWCASVDPGTNAPSDSLVLLLAQAVRRAE